MTPPEGDDATQTAEKPGNTGASSDVRPAPDEAAARGTEPNAEGDGSGVVMGETDEADRQATSTRSFMRPGAPGFGPRPGDPDYAPPARLAQQAGMVLEPKHYDYAGQLGSQGTSVTGQTPLAMPAPAYQTVTTDVNNMRPSQLSAQSATTMLRKISGDFSAWIADFPHPLTGELAVIAQFWRDLSARRAALNTAAALGRTVGPDEVDEATSTPSPEFFQLRHMAASVEQMAAIYDGVLGDNGIELPGEAKAAVERIKGDFEHLQGGPTSAEEADINPANEPQALNADSPELHSAVPVSPAQQRRRRPVPATQPQKLSVENEPAQA